MKNPLKNCSIGLGVTGSIASYKALDLASKLVQQGASVHALMTGGATKIVTPLAFTAITHNSVGVDLYDPSSDIGMDHVSVAKTINLLIIAPATANTIAKMAFGIADNPVTTTYLATESPVILVPAMDGNMYSNKATQTNLNILKDREVKIIGPYKGHLASGLQGIGRMAETNEIIEHAKLIIAQNGDMANYKIVVTAGGTKEPLDPIRVITNRSSGKMGFAIAEAARDRGASVTLITSSIELPNILGVDTVIAKTADEMATQTKLHIKKADAIIMAAAISDWKPTVASLEKIKKVGANTLNLELTKTEDVIASINGSELIKVGFAAETENLVQNAKIKLKEKNLDLVVANQINQENPVFGAETNKVVFIDKHGEEDLPEIPKYDIGHLIIDRLKTMVNKNA
ncbi:MAG: bifunctional phosphopantothenoylcysteine decarboxylase/phosphopantothenate--cysteine ligase CoaBC [Dehalococcoidia bacterium]|nr:bifunctional phosphopantothenoylcysteine decarboxylase/phosphopantothenate--cysteine ligase CoaBC [Dehalococcoidia bacterium]|tara:strand:+ start:402 stop:1607 length:1206 start_codon:yes stop_codon:yes gene_type:complete